MDNDVIAPFLCFAFILPFILMCQAYHKNRAEKYRGTEYGKMFQESAKGYSNLAGCWIFMIILLGALVAAIVSK